MTHGGARPSLIVLQIGQATAHPGRWRRIVADSVTALVVMAPVCALNRVAAARIQKRIDLLNREP